MATRAVSIARVWSWAAQALFGDLRVRYGIKIGLAGMLALFCTQLLRLPNDNWAILTVLVMMSAQFVGPIAFKGIMRVTGNRCRSPRWRLVGQRLYVHARDLSARPFPSDGFRQLQVRPSRRTASFLMPFFCLASPRWSSRPMGLRIQHKPGRSALTERRRS